ncbi:MAG TPA: DUF262 domain-containing protein [Candidatus Paceibacterota bacterium]|nr:DUF262 domain-containing protein [Candidatus Paceibacterota bacterium]HRZ55657.1 DUF262 domain-containing protein [Candidatus Paceibacterota bacterium]
MATFDSTKTALGKLLEEILEGKIQLPDFQRGWVWDDSHIRSLLVSIARSFPIGSIMLLETGGTASFQIRAIEGVAFPPGAKPAAEKLILDGQQRLTSLTQVLRQSAPVQTRDDNGREVQRFYYMDIEKALAGNSNLEDSIVPVDANKMLRANFGRDVVLDLSALEKEFQAFHFPCNQILNSDQWEEGLMAFDDTKFKRYMEFRKRVLNAFREYQVPVIELKKETSKEAVCLVFEKVNTGGVPLSVFELVTATYAADGFNLRDDWYGNARSQKPGRHKKFAAKPLLHDIEPTDFLQGLSLLHTYEQRLADLAAGLTGKAVTPVSAKREHVLSLPLAAFNKWADQLTQGFLEADRFLRMEGFHSPKFLPYRSQLVPIAAAMVHLGQRWLEPVIRNKLARWFWCGVLGELYGGAVETRIALDLQNLLAWIDQAGAPEPVTVVAAGFQPARLDTLRTRTSAAYRGIYVLLQREGSRDFFWKARMVDLDRDDCKLDIHHIFPRDWCEDQHIQPKVFNSIVNKTPISYKANRMIGGKAPSKYLNQIRDHAQVQITDAEQDNILKTHLINPLLLRADKFTDFYADRKAALIRVIEQAMGKAVVAASPDAPAEDAEDETEET